MGKKSQKTSQSTVYGNTTTSNPYATASTNNKGTVTNFKPGTAMDTIYNTVNNNIDGLLNEYLNPSLQSTVNQAKLNSFINTVNSNSRGAMENNIINPLSNRNMIRSSQATDLYNKLARQNASSIEQYVSDLLTNSQENSANLINNLMNLYLAGANYLSGVQNTSLQTSSGNAQRTTTGTSNGLSNLLADVLNSASTVSKFL